MHLFKRDAILAFEVRYANEKLTHVTTSCDSTPPIKALLAVRVNAFIRGDNIAEGNDKQSL